MSTKIKYDLFLSYNQGETVGLFMPLSDRGRQWLDENFGNDPDNQWLGESLAVEWRFIDPILAFALEEGLEVA